MKRIFRSCFGTLRPFAVLAFVGCGGAEVEDAAAGDTSASSDGITSQDRGQANSFVPRHGNFDLDDETLEVNALRCRGDGGGLGKTKICHATGSTTQPFTLIAVSNGALRAHRHHGDIIPAPPEGCPGETPPPPVCAPGSTASCYDGPPGTEGVGTCTTGTMTCNADGTGYGECGDAVTPVSEACGDGADNDCDGVADDGCVCAPGSMSPCYAGPSGTEDVGACRAGTQTCNATGTGFEACTGAVEPVAEVCGDNVDNDCDGNVDNGCITGFAWFDMGSPIRRSWGNGLQDASEFGMANLPIRLMTSAGTLVASTLTDTGGIYSFGGVAPGVYYLDATAFAGQNIPAGAPALVVTLVTRNLSIAEDHESECLLFGICRTTDVVNGCASGLVHRMPTFPDPEPRPIPDVPFRLRTGTGALVDSAVTDASGRFSFECVSSGEHYVEMTFVLDERIPRNYVSATFANNSSDDTRDSDFANPVFEGGISRIRTPAFTLTATAPITDFDIGYGDFND